MVLRKHAAIERIGDGIDPPVMERVEQSGIDAGPIVNRHGGIPR